MEKSSNQKLLKITDKSIVFLSQLSVIFIIFGQLIKIPLFNISGKNFSVLPLEISVSLMVFLWVLKKIFHKEKIIPKTELKSPIIIFIIIGLISLVVGSFKLNLNFNQFASSLTYLIRWSIFALAFFVYLDLFKESRFKERIINIFLFSSVMIALVGIIQYFIFPNMEQILKFFNYLDNYIWDPHISRLVSTFLDPNLLAGFLILPLTILAVYFSKNYLKNNKVIFLSISIFLITTAIMLTYSRSGYLAIFILLFFLFFKKLFKSLILIIITIIVVSPLYFQGIAKRAEHSLKTAEYIAKEKPSVEPEQKKDNPDIDYSGMARIKSWIDATEIIKRNLVLGVGYNNYFYATEKYDLHRTYGSDSSLLFSLATTGIFGFISFILILKNIFIRSFIVFKENKDDFLQKISLSFIIFLPIIIVHSFFTNSLFYPHIMISFWFLAAIIFSNKSVNNNL